jgi:peroxiredoxin/uncharacterized membrane protein YphA (DoxX/SURF4 family)
LRILEYSLLAARLLLAAVFLLAGVTKLFDHAGSRKALRDFGLPEVLTSPAAVLLPLCELAVFALLLSADLAWQAAWTALGLLVIFLLAMAVALVRGRKPDCHCFGQLHAEPVGWATFIRNIVLAGCAAGVIAAGPGRSGADVWSWLGGLDGRRKIAVAAACVVVLLFLRMFAAMQETPEPAAETPELLPLRPKRTAPAPAAYEPTSEGPAHEIKASAGVGLPIGTSAPDFELPDLNGQKHSLASLLEGHQQIVFLFVNPFCKPCQTVVDNLPKWTRQLPGLPQVVVISQGTAQQNAAKVKEGGPTQVLLQQGLEIAGAYDCTMTPAAVVVGADRCIKTNAAVGSPAIWELLSSCAKAAVTAGARTQAD